jgi:ABC-type uncharacterized transport system permease subunit
VALAAIGATVVFSSFLVMLAGASPFTVFYLVFKGAAGSQFALVETLTRATPLIFTGLAVAVAFAGAAMEHRRRGPALSGAR